MISKEELNILIKENINGNAYDILVQECCEVIKEKLEYKKEYTDINDLYFLLVRLYYLDIDFKYVILQIYDLITSDSIEEESLYELYYNIQKIKEMKFIKKTAELSEELKYLLSIGKTKFARMMIEENYYNKVFGKTLKKNNIEFNEEESFLELCKKISEIKVGYLNKVAGIISEKNELKRIELLLEYSDDFSNRKIIIYDREYFEDLTQDWLFEIAYNDLKNCFINKFLKILNKESEEENIDKLFNELCTEICAKITNIARECNEIKNRMNNTFETNDERNIENINRLLDLYEMIEKK